MVRVGDLVRYWFDTGRNYDFIYGIVEKSGPKTFTVRWESGIRNRVRHENPDVTLARPGEIDVARVEKLRAG